MKKLCSLCLCMILCLTSTAFALYVPESSSKLPDMLSAPQAPAIVRVQQQGDAVTITLEDPLPAESLVTAYGLDDKFRTLSIHADPSANGTYTAKGLPAGGQWTGFDIAWVKGDVNALARYNHAGGLETVTRYDSRFNEYIFNNDGIFCEFAYADTSVRARFNSRGVLLSYGYEAQRNTTVWFNLAGDILHASYDDGVFAAQWEPGRDWFVSTPDGRQKVSLNVSPWGARPLYAPEKGEEADPVEVIHYPNNTISLAGLTLREASSTLPDKWYNVIPVDLTRQGRQTYFLTISNMHYIGECYVDVWGDEVTVRCSLLENSAIQHKSSYGRWFTRLGDITAASIESSEEGFTFGEPVSIARDLDGAEVALLFIRSKASYYLPFKDGSTLTRYWRNKAEWKEFRQGLQELMPLVEK